MSVNIFNFSVVECWKVLQILVWCFLITMVLVLVITIALEYSCYICVTATRISSAIDSLIKSIMSKGHVIERYDGIFGCFQVWNTWSLISCQCILDVKVSAGFRTGGFLSPFLIFLHCSFCCTSTSKERLVTIPLVIFHSCCLFDTDSKN